MNESFIIDKMIVNSSQTSQWNSLETLTENHSQNTLLSPSYITGVLFMLFIMAILLYVNFFYEYTCKDVCKPLKNSIRSITKQLDNNNTQSTVNTGYQYKVIFQDSIQDNDTTANCK
jgi:hypothetical protein